MDGGSSYNLEIWIIARQTRARWFSLNKVANADCTNFVDLIFDVENNYPDTYGDVVTLFTFALRDRRTSNFSPTKICLTCLQNIRTPSAAT
jgi:hypothetical protein